MVSTKPCGNHFKSRALARPAVAPNETSRESSMERSHGASARALIRIVRQPADSRRLRSSASPRALASLGGSFCAPAMLTRGAFRASRRARLSAQTTFVRNLNNITVRFFRDARRSGQRPGPFGLEERAEPGWRGGGGGVRAVVSPHSPRALRSQVGVCKENADGETRVALVPCGLPVDPPAQSPLSLLVRGAQGQRHDPDEEGRQGPGREGRWSAVRLRGKREAGLRRAPSLRAL